MNSIELVRKYGSPLYVYDLDQLRKRLKFFRGHMPQNGRAHFALKCNNTPGVLRVVREEGFGVDVVSSGELECALENGFLAEDIVFSGVGKSVGEIELAISKNIKQLNVESLPELKRIIDCARRLKCVAPVAFRMNPDVDAKTHPYIRTGFRDNKFGIDFSEISELMARVRSSGGAVELRGLTLHIGSQIREVAPFAAAIRKTFELYKSVASAGFSLSTFDVGGGVGLDYHQRDESYDEAMIAEYMRSVKELLVESGAVSVREILFEPGRVLVARCGSLLTEVQYVKRTPFKNFLIVDAGMHMLMRPALYQAHHAIVPTRSYDGPSETFDVVGPICESSDVVGAARYLPAGLQSGDVLAILDVGAYGSVMSSSYNLRGPVREICLSGDKVVDVKERA